MAHDLGLPLDIVGAERWRFRHIGVRALSHRSQFSARQNNTTRGLPHMGQLMHEPALIPERCIREITSRAPFRKHDRASKRHHCAEAKRRRLKDADLAPSDLFTEHRAAKGDLAFGQRAPLAGPHQILALLHDANVGEEPRSGQTRDKTREMA